LDSDTCRCNDPTVFDAGYVHSSRGHKWRLTTIGLLAVQVLVQLSNRSGRQLDFRSVTVNDLLVMNIIVVVDVIRVRVHHIDFHLVRILVTSCHLLCFFVRVASRGYTVIPYDGPCATFCPAGGRLWSTANNIFLLRRRDHAAALRLSGLALWRVVHHLLLRMLKLRGRKLAAARVAARLGLIVAR